MQAALVVAAVATVAGTAVQIQSSQKQAKLKKRQLALEEASRNARLRRETRRRQAQILNTSAQTGTQFSTAREGAQSSIESARQRETEFGQQMDAITRSQIDTNTSSAVTGAIIEGVGQIAGLTFDAANAGLFESDTSGSAV